MTLRTNFLRVLLVALVMALAAGLMVLAGQPAKEAQAQAQPPNAECRGFLTGTFQNVTVPEGQFCFLSNSTVLGNAKSLEDATFFSVNNRIDGNLVADKSRRVFWTGLASTAFDPAPPVGSNAGFVGGNVLVRDLRGDPASSFNIGICALDVRGNLIVEKAMDARIEIGSRLPNCAMGNDVAGNLQVFQNRLSAQQVGRFFDDLSVFNNDVGGELQVFRNVSPTANNPQNVEMNRVQGNAQVFRNMGPGDKRVVNNTIREDLQCFRNDDPFVGQPNTVGGQAQGQCAAPSQP